jgi:hypothetical protein
MQQSLQFLLVVPSIFQAPAQPLYNHRCPALRSHFGGRRSHLAKACCHRHLTDDDFGAMLDRAIARSIGKLIEAKIAPRDPDVDNM